MDDITVPQEYVDGVQDDGEGGDVPAVEEDDD